MLGLQKISTPLWLGYRYWGSVLQSCYFHPLIFDFTYSSFCFMKWVHTCWEHRSLELLCPLDCALRKMTLVPFDCLALSGIRTVSDTLLVCSSICLESYFHPFTSGYHLLILVAYFLETTNKWILILTPRGSSVSWLWNYEHYYSELLLRRYTLILSM